MGAAGLVGASRRRSITTTKRDSDHRPDNNLVRRNFFVEKPNALWVADITFAPTPARFLFLAVVLGRMVQAHRWLGFLGRPEDLRRARRWNPN